jgi:hypothetical protein
MALTKVSYSMISGALINILDYGAVGNGVADDTVAIQAALDAAENIAGCVYIAPGTFKITSTLTIPASVSIKGASAESSVIRPTGCDGLQFASSNNIGPRVFEDFFIYGNGTETNTGMKFVGTASTAIRISGIRINRIRIQNFRDALNFRGMWTSSITNCVLYFNIYGIVLRGQCVKVDVCNNYVAHNLLGQVVPNATGLVIESTFDYDPGGTTERRPEDIQVHQNLIYNFPFGCRINNVLLVSVNDNDFDGTTNTGITIGSTGGLTSICDNWIGLIGATPVQGIFLSALAVSADCQKNIINNQINNSGTTATYGIYAYTNQNNINIIGNDISGTNNDIQLQNCGDIVVSGNLCRSTTGSSMGVLGTLVGRTIEISNNSLSRALIVNPTNFSQILLGQNSGLNSTFIQGKSTILSGTTTVTTTYASLSTGLPNFNSATTFINPKLFVQTPVQAVGSISGTANDSQVTITCTSAPVGDMAIYWEVRGFTSSLA